MLYTDVNSDILKIGHWPPYTIMCKICHSSIKTET